MRLEANASWKRGFFVQATLSLDRPVLLLLRHSDPHPPTMRALKLAGLLLLGLMSVAIAAPCSETSEILMGKQMALQIVDSALLARPVDSAGRVVTNSIQLSIALAVAVERTRTQNFGDASPTCHYAHQIAPWTPNLNVNTSVNGIETYGPIINYIDISSMNCEATLDKIVHNGVNVSRVRMAYSMPNSTFRLESLFELPDGSTIKEVYQNTNYTTNHTLYTTYYQYVAVIVGCMATCHFFFFFEPAGSFSFPLIRRPSSSFTTLSPSNMHF